MNSYQLSGGVAIPSGSLVKSFTESTHEHQTNTIRYLIYLATDSSNGHSTIQNSKISLIHLQEHLSDDVKTSIASIYSDDGRTKIDAGFLETLKYTGVLRFIKNKAKSKFYECIYKSMTEIGVDWYKGLQHIELLQSFKELGSLNECPNHYQTDILIWMALTYIGQEERNTKHISDRDVFFSKEASSIIQNLIKESNFITDEMIATIHYENSILALTENTVINKRFNRFCELAELNRKNK